MTNPLGVPILGDLEKISSTDAPAGHGWFCLHPGCGHWASLGGNAVYHAKRLDHGAPQLMVIPDGVETMDRAFARMRDTAQPVTPVKLGYMTMSGEIEARPAPAPKRAPLDVMLAVTRFGNAHRELARLAIEWVLADRIANAREDELALIETDVLTQECDPGEHHPSRKGSIQRHHPRIAAARTAYEEACEREQQCDEAWRRAAQALVKELESP